MHANNRRTLTAIINTIAATARRLATSPDWAVVRFPLAVLFVVFVALFLIIGPPPVFADGGEGSECAQQDCALAATESGWPRISDQLFGDDLSPDGYTITWPDAGEGNPSHPPHRQVPLKVGCRVFPV
jgi:hypothetical protein